jgi:hypothetical protein
MVLGNIIHVPIEVAIKPMSGRVICNSFWIIHPEYGISFYNPENKILDRVGAPQCNDNFAVSQSLFTTAKTVNGKTYLREGYYIKKIESVYLSSCFSWAKNNISFDDHRSAYSEDL